MPNYITVLITAMHLDYLLFNEQNSALNQKPKIEKII